MTSGSHDNSASSRWIARGIIALTVACVFAGFTFLYWKWITVREPSSVVVVEGVAELAGAEVVVEGAALEQPYRSRLSREEQYRAPFYLDGGTYTVRVTHEGEQILETEILLGRNDGRRLDLGPLVRR